MYLQKRDADMKRTQLLNVIMILFIYFAVLM